MYIDGQFVELLEINRPTSYQYMILESEISGTQRAIHILDFSELSQFTIGRRAKN